jgi:hypothetical protein
MRWCRNTAHKTAKADCAKKITPFFQFFLAERAGMAKKVGFQKSLHARK